MNTPCRRANRSPVRSRFEDEHHAACDSTQLPDGPECERPKAGRPRASRRSACDAVCVCPHALDAARPPGHCTHARTAIPHEVMLRARRWPLPPSTPCPPASEGRHRRCGPLRCGQLRSWRFGELQLAAAAADGMHEARLARLCPQGRARLACAHDAQVGRMSQRRHLGTRGSPMIASSRRVRTSRRPMQ